MTGHVLCFCQLVQTLGYSKKQLTPNISAHNFDGQWYSSACDFVSVDDNPK